MKYAKLFGKTVREAPKEAKLVSHKLLYQAGFIRELVSGRYSLLPLGLLVLDKIKKIIKEEMDGIGSMQITTPTLHPIELWKKTNRTASMGPTLMRLKDRRDSEFVLGATHEEVFVDLVKKFSLSEKDLPITLYQFSNKFRDELRARGGLIRVREFLMKDAYSFHADSKTLEKTYADMYKAYQKIFDRIGVPTIPVEADSGAIGGKFSHEFMLEDKDGEDLFVKCDNCGYSANTEKAEGFLEDKNPEEKEENLMEIDAVRGVNMEAMSQFFKCSLWRLLKSVVYKVKKDNKYSFVLVLIRGDLDINEIKLSKILECSDFELASDEDLKKLKTVRGFVSPVNLKVDNYIADSSVLTVKNLITGANILNRDFKNFNLKRDLPSAQTVDIAVVNSEFICSKCRKGHFQLKRGIETGHIFRLDYYYSRPMEAGFTAKDGSFKNFLMGCYGIGLERAMAAIVEANNDEKGIKWPKSVAPFQVHLIGLNLNEPDIEKQAEETYLKIKKSGIEILYDDRVDVSPGVKFKDCDLIGIPVRLVVSKKTAGKIEFKKRADSRIDNLSLEKVLSQI